MTPAELAELIRSGEDSGLEFKRDDIQNHDLAKELVAFLNLDGGTILLGVEDDGTISGTTRENLDDWVAELCRTKIEPPVIPSLSWARDIEPGNHVLAVRVTLGPSPTPGSTAVAVPTSSESGAPAGRRVARNWSACSRHRAAFTTE